MRDFFTYFAIGYFTYNLLFVFVLIILDKPGKLMALFFALPMTTWSWIQR
jgi:hypothetical protein